MPQTRLIRPCHPKNLSVNHLYPIELTRIWGATPFQPQRRPVSNSSNCGLSQLPTLYNNFNKIEGLYQESPTWVHYFTSWTKDGSWRDSNPRIRFIFRPPPRRGLHCRALYRLSYRSLCSVWDSNPRSVMVCDVNILSISWWPSPQDTINLDTPQTCEP